MILYDSCPCCGQKRIAPVLSATDYTVSHEVFEIWACAACGLRFTQAVPDADMIGRYYQSENYISHSDTQVGIINKVYHKVRFRALVHKRKIIERLSGKKNGTLLDIGCGTGAFLHTMQQSGWQVTGLEPDAATRQRAQQFYQLNVEPSEKLFSLPAKRFDVITMWHVLEHVHQLHGYLHQIKELSAPGGKLLIAVPNYTSHDQAVYQQYWAAYDVPRHLYHFSPHSMQVLLSQHAMKIDRLLPMWYDSFYVSMLSEGYKTGKSHLVSAAATGALSNLKALFDTRKCSSVIYVVDAG
jgi:2-polyprenyl-3-methyl-5-hydroxy-6-metoxy-1,4-benzoquinol methylase